jgi:palmitoyltransferase ZDHHC1/11
MKIKNGFSQKLNCEQIIGLILALIMICIYCVIVLPMLMGLWQILNGVVYSFLSLGTLIFAGICAYVDPTDNEPPHTSSKYCTICRKAVCKSSKHCSQCNRCVSGFDHHCSWINNCIGNLNYRWFFITILFLELLIGFQLSASIYVVVVLYISPDKLNKIFNKELVYSFIGLSLLILGFLFVSNGILIGFHVYLFFRRSSTYEFVIHRRKKSTVRTI